MRTALGTSFPLGAPHAHPPRRRAYFFSERASIGQVFETLSGYYRQGSPVPAQRTAFRRIDLPGAKASFGFNSQWGFALVISALYGSMRLVVIVTLQFRVSTCRLRSSDSHCLLKSEPPNRSSTGRNVRHDLCEEATTLKTNFKHTKCPLLGRPHHVASVPCT